MPGIVTSLTRRRFVRSLVRPGSHANFKKKKNTVSINIIEQTTPLERTNEPKRKEKRCRMDYEHFYVEVSAVSTRRRRRRHRRCTTRVSSVSHPKRRRSRDRARVAPPTRRRNRNRNQSETTPIPSWWRAFVVKKPPKASSTTGYPFQRFARRVRDGFVGV